LDRPLNSKSGVDTDGDGISDWEEVNHEAISKILWNAGVIEKSGFRLPTIQECIDYFNNSTYVKSGLDRFKDIQGYICSKYISFCECYECEIGRRRILPILSNPADADTSGNGIIDSDDIWRYHTTRSGNRSDTRVWSVVRNDNDKLRASLPAIDPSVEEQDSEDILRRRFDIVATGLNEKITIPLGGTSIHPYPNAPRTLGGLNGGDTAHVVQIVFRASKDAPQYWLKVRMSSGVHGFINQNDRIFKIDDYLYKDDAWVWVFRDDTVVGDRLATTISQVYHDGHKAIDVTAGDSLIKTNEVLTWVSKMRLQEYPIFSPINGKIVDVFENSDGNGYGVAIEAIIDEITYRISLIHFEFAPLVNLHDRVTPHTMLGIAGNTGRSDNYHLHMVIRKNENPIDPVTKFPEIFGGG
jgi:hypothetical protein